MTDVMVPRGSTGAGHGRQLASRRVTARMDREGTGERRETWTMEPAEHTPMNDAEPPTPSGDGLEPTSWPSATVAPMELSVSHHESGVSVIEIVGELDALTTPLLDECLSEQLDEHPTHLVIDLAEVTFLGSSGLAALVRCSRTLEASESGSVLHLTGATHRAVRRPLELVGLLPLFSIHATQDDALAHIASEPGPAT